MIIDEIHSFFFTHKKHDRLFMTKIQLEHTRCFLVYLGD